MRKYHYLALLVSASFFSMAGEHTVSFSASVVERPCPIQSENHTKKLIEDSCVPFEQPVYEAIYDTEDDGITVKHIGDIVHVTYL